MRLTESKISGILDKHIAQAAKSKLSEDESVRVLAATLSEDEYLKKGQKVYVTASMGLANVVGTFEEESNGWARVRKEDGTDCWVHYFHCFPQD